MGVELDAVSELAAEANTGVSEGAVIFRYLFLHEMRLW